jgi:dihydropteroate synthase
LWAVAAEAGAGWVVMHMRGEPSNMGSFASYGDVVGEVKSFLVERAEKAKRRWCREIWVDPGIGFAKTTAHNLQLLAHLDELRGDGMAGCGRAFAEAFHRGRRVRGRRAASSPEDRLEGSLTGAVWALLNGTALVRAHDVKATVDAAKLVGVK